LGSPINKKSLPRPGGKTLIVHGADRTDVHEQPRLAGGLGRRRQSYATSIYLKYEGAISGQDSV
jgi:hypothetical protein